VKDQALREAVVAAARRMVELGLTHGTSGNLSVRAGPGLLITPTALPWHLLGPDHIVRLDAAGLPEPGAGAPSTEWRIHRDIYAARGEAGAVLHAHPPYATAIACLGKDLPAVHYMVAVAGGASVRCAGYATFGTAELSAAALAALEGRTACLLANHGIVALGADLDEALRVAEEIERVAQVYWLALAAGTPRILDDAEMLRVLQSFASYGRPSNPSASGGRGGT
jgi:L-fuculose-phosphate aldolase